VERKLGPSKRNLVFLLVGEAFEAFDVQGCRCLMMYKNYFGDALEFPTIACLIMHLIGVRRLMWALGKLQYPTQDVAYAVGDQLLADSRLPGYDAQKLTLLTWGYAMMDVNPGTLPLTCYQQASYAPLDPLRM
jgi:hypothetical protein